jgi:hypothetical protein
MSTSPETRADDRVVNAISRWLARHISDEELRRELDVVDRAALAPEQADAVDELVAELGAGLARGGLERAARETMEAVALGT